MHRPRTLRSRLFSWFVGAILLSALTSALVVSHARPEAAFGIESIASHMGDRLAQTWDDPEASRAFVAEVRDVTGFDVRLTRDAHHLPVHVRRFAQRGAAFVVEGPAHVAIPVFREGALLGALDVDGLNARGGGWAWWRFALALILVLAVLSAMAGGVANQLARPLERMARAADRFGAGDLAFRTDVVGGRHRWVAREVRDVAVSFNRMADRVEAMVRGQRELLGAISHELRSPLGRARVALEIARDRLASGPSAGPSEPTEPSTAAALDDVESQLVAVDAILGDLLDVTRTGLADLRKESRDLVAWLRDRVAEEPDAPPIQVDIGSPGAKVESFVLAFDAALLHRALHNLLVNARAHGHPADQPLELGLAIEARAGTSWARVTVRDHGPGFASGFVERAFEPFVRGDASRARPASGAGYGLGLAIVKRVVEAHGGRVFARNAPGGGAAVGFELPGPVAGR
jgi:two-component system OmpR family sensor kinase